MTLGIKLLMASNLICNEIQKINIRFYVHSKIEFTIRIGPEWFSAVCISFHLAYRS